MCLHQIVCVERPDEYACFINNQ
ncbi:MAG: hypothetical protein LBG78_02265 [Azoarcus sp.]|nr:hypothetical protein [Azoarcus sp.]